MSGRSEVTVTSLGKTSFLFICIHLQHRTSSLHRVFRVFGLGKRSATERRREASLPWSAPQRGFQTGIFLSCFSAPQDPLCFCRWRYSTHCLMKNEYRQNRIFRKLQMYLKYIYYLIPTYFLLVILPVSTYNIRNRSRKSVITEL